MSTVLRTTDPEALNRRVGDPRSADETQTWAELAHHLREALTVISGAAQLTERRMGTSENSPDTVFIALRDVRDAVNRMALQVAELEDLAMVKPERAPATEHRLWT